MQQSLTGSPRKIAFVFTSMPVGGAEDFALGVGPHLAHLQVSLPPIDNCGEERLDDQVATGHQRGARRAEQPRLCRGVGEVADQVERRDDDRVAAVRPLVRLCEIAQQGPEGAVGEVRRVRRQTSEHLGRGVHAHHRVPPFGQRDGQPTGAHPQLEHATGRSCQLRDAVHGIGRGVVRGVPPVVDVRETLPVGRRGEAVITVAHAHSLPSASR